MDQPHTHTLKYLLAETGTLKALFKFIHKTRRFEATYGDLTRNTGHKHLDSPPLAMDHLVHTVHMHPSL